MFIFIANRSVRCSSRLMSDPVHDLAHDHFELNRRVMDLGAAIAAARTDSGERAHSDERATGLAAQLEQLRDSLFAHFAREEEGLFPFVSQTIRELDYYMREMTHAHDTICGTLARMHHLAVTGSAFAFVAAAFERFEAAYAEHATQETALFEVLDRRLDPLQRTRLALLVRDL